jgi:hypothetical protein
MADASAARRKLDRYLRELHAGLRGLSRGEAAEIVEELRSHVHDCAGGGELTDAGVTAALERLGRPQQLAARYLAEGMAGRAVEGRAPGRVMRTMVGGAILSGAAVMVCLGALVGYALAATFCLCAVRKPFAPDRVGLWRLAENPDTWSLRLGFGRAPHGTEFLGWWIVPLGLLLGVGLFMLTVRFGWWASQTLRWRRRGFPVH